MSCERKTQRDWARFVRQIADSYQDARRITLVMDNLNTHKPASLYEVFAPEEARRLRERFEFIYTPRHGSWLNMAEIELNVLIAQCLGRHMESLGEMTSAVAAWQNHRNNLNARINGQFTAENARTKLRRLYPTLDM